LYEGIQQGLIKATSPDFFARINTAAVPVTEIPCLAAIFRPENWIPFIPVHNPGSNREIRLQRAVMHRLISSTIDNVPVEPKSAILRSGLNEDPQQPYFLHEEEVSKASTQVTRTYQRVRWWNGQVYTWLGRKKQKGRGQGASGLEFDRITPKNEEER
jgi:hypothetical protein